MYSRYSFPRGEGVKLPENYSGCAFSRGAPPPAPPHDPPPLKRPEPPLPLPVPMPPKEELPPSPPPAELPQKPPLAMLPALTGALDFDQLLILGLILLLLHSGEDREIVLWLILLLFC